jgi:hypothetical protein
MSDVALSSLLFVADFGHDLLCFSAAAGEKLDRFRQEMNSHCGSLQSLHQIQSSSTVSFHPCACGPMSGVALFSLLFVADLGHDLSFQRCYWQKWTDFVEK